MVKRTYDHVSDEEKLLAIECKNPHEFYQQYMEKFGKKKSPLAIGKIWARRSTFKREQFNLPPETTNPSDMKFPAECEEILTRQNNLIAELIQLKKEHNELVRDNVKIILTIAGNKAPKEYVEKYLTEFKSD